MSDLIDTTEMYLRTIYELMEEGTPPMRARIAERLHQSGPTVSQTVARMERDGLVSLAQDRHLVLTEEGLVRATSVMRKHRLAERLLTDVIGLDWAYVHGEACRWEHVMSDRVERRLVELLEDTVESPYGNPIPGLADFGGEQRRFEDFLDGAVPVTTVLREVPTRFRSRRLAEPLQADTDLLETLKTVGVRPGSSFTATRETNGDVRFAAVDGDATTVLDPARACLVYVAPPEDLRPA